MDKTIPQLQEIATVAGDTSFLVIDNGIQTYKIKPINIPGLPKTPILELEVTVSEVVLVTVLHARGYAYADKNGVWKFNFNITLFIEETTLDAFGVYIEGIVFDFPSNSQYVGVNTNGSSPSNLIATTEGAFNKINIRRDTSESTDYSRVNIFGDVFLQEAPEWVNPAEFRNSDGFSNRDAGAVSSVNGQIGDVNLTTSDIPEGSRLYFTDARAKAGAVTDALTPGVTDRAPSMNAVVTALNGKQSTSQKNSNNGYAGLDGSGKLFSSQLPTSILGSLVYKGAWNAASGSYPSSPSQGWYYVVNNPGVISGVSYAVQDWMIYNGSSWDKLAGTESIVSVNSQTGIVVLDTDDISEGSTNKYFTEALARGAAVANAINDGETAIAPSQNVVFDALALKADAATTSAAIADKLDKVSGIASGLEISDYILFNETTTPPTPGANEIAFYPKADGKFYLIGDDGVEKQAGGSGSGTGEINLILSPNESTGWTGTATVATDVTPSNFPLEGVYPTAIKISSALSGQYREYVFAVPPVLARKMKLELWFEHAGNNTDWKVELYKAGVKQALKTDVSGNSYLLPGVGRWYTDFDFEVASYSLRIVRAASVAQDIFVQGAVVGPGSIGQVPAIGNEVIYTPTLNNFTAAYGTRSAYWLRQVTRMKGHVDITLGAVSAIGGIYSITIPDGKSIDLILNPVESKVGEISIFDASASYLEYLGSVHVLTATTLQFKMHGQTAFNNATAPITLAISDVLSIDFDVPITEWANSGTIPLGPRAEPTYASNSSVTTATDTTSFQYGEDGALVQAFAPSGATGVAKRVRSPYPNPKFPILQIKNNNTNWVSVGDSAYGFQNVGGATNYGIDLTPVTGSTTDYNVNFYSQIFQGAAWSSANAAGTRWRVVFADTPAAVGIEPATATSSGLVSNEIAPTTVALTVANLSGTTTVNAVFSRTGKQVTMFIPAIASGTASGAGVTFTGIPTQYQFSNSSIALSWPSMVVAGVGQHGQLYSASATSFTARSQATANLTTGTFQTERGVYFTWFTT